MWVYGTRSEPWAYVSVLICFYTQTGAYAGFVTCASDADFLVTLGHIDGHIIPSIASVFTSCPAPRLLGFHDTNLSPQIQYAFHAIGQPCAREKHYDFLNIYYAS